MDECKDFRVDGLYDRVKELEAQVAEYQTFLERFKKALDGVSGPAPVGISVPRTEPAPAPVIETKPETPETAKPKKAAAAPKKKSEPKKLTIEGECATDSDLDGKYGDPEVFKDPRDWDGPSYKGKKYSDCPPEYLIMIAKMLDWLAADNKEKGATAANGKPRHVYQELDAKRARGWAKRKLSGDSEPPPSSFDDAEPSSYDFNDA